MRTNLLFIIGTALIISGCQQSGKVGTDGFATVNYSEEATRGQISEALQMQFSIVEESARPMAKILRLVLESMEGTQITIDEKTRLFILDEQLIGIAENLHILSGTPVKLEGNKFRLRSKAPIKRSLIVTVDNQEAELKIDGEVSKKGEIINYEVQIGMKDVWYKIATYTKEDDLVFNSRQIEKFLADQFLGGKTIFNGSLDEEGIVYKVDIKNKYAFLIKRAAEGVLEYQLFDSPYMLTIDYMKLVISEGKLKQMVMTNSIEGRITNVETPSVDPLVVFDSEGFEISYHQSKEDEEIHVFTRKQWDEL